ncbi:MAG: endonuclease/exonuclease/phosphatase family protein [Candidatus Nanoarchaeia archaeon]|nr:endonuclease/exonuclease/phosphatase family protein [Candidatus Nanoarchaeia archaeon]MDD5357683.1 endonuclease/exonuclease/phosphatase family protein [Candidatus Nanoarchaeia archaeon]MDD5588602.1 endonuclease/exonuclease/phosphatase family protein [Candidatus Nanoarchaeia archaeon]
MQLKIITLNVWRYYEWETRKQKLLNFLRKENADIIFFQEVASSEKSKWENQIDEINEKLKYPYSSYSNMAHMTKWHEKPINYLMFYGLGFISKYRIKKSEFVKLKPVLKNKDFGFLHLVIETSKGDIDLIDVHFENTDKGAKKQLKETIKWIKQKNISPIIAGDFNMKNINDLIKILGKDYEISCLIKPYFSFMPTEFSNNKEPITLDYIVVKKNKFKIEEIKCIEDSPSDHKPIIAEIKTL